MYGIIYKITCLVTNKIYIGKTTKTINERFKAHIRASILERSYISYLYNAMNKYGVDNFIIEELEQCENKEHLNNREIYWIQTLHSQDKSIGYNIQDGGEGGNVRSSEWSPSKKQLEALDYGRHLPASEIQKIQLSRRRKDIIVSDTTREKLSKAASGRCVSDLTKQKMSKSHKGLKMPLRNESQRRNYANASSDRIHIHKGNQNKNPKSKDLEQYLQDGWELGYHYKNE